MVSLFVHHSGLYRAASSAESTTLVQMNYHDLKNKICTRSLGASLGGRSARKRLAYRLNQRENSNKMLCFLAANSNGDAATNEDMHHAF